jgi:hypothetical protein
MAATPIGLDRRINTTTPATHNATETHFINQSMKEYEGTLEVTDAPDR